MSDVSGDELSSLYKSIKKRETIPKVKLRQREKFQSILEKTRVPNRSLSSRYIDSSTELIRLNLNASQTIHQRHNHNKFIRGSRRNKTNVFTGILNATNHQNSSTAGETRNQEKNKSRNSINPVEGYCSDTLPLDSDHSNKVLDIHRPLLRPAERIQAYSRAEVRRFANAFSSEENIQEPHNALHTDSADSSKSTDTPKLSAKKFKFKVRRLPEINTVRRVGLENILNPSGQSHSNDIVVSKLSSDEDNSDLSITKNRLKKKSRKFSSNYENILVTNSSKNENPEVLSAVSSSSKKRQHGIHDKPASASDDYENKVSSQLTGQNKNTFMSTFHSTHRNISQFNIEHYFRKMPKSRVHNSNLYSNNSELVESNVLENNRKGEDPSLVTKHPEENYNNSQFKVPALSIENQVSKYNKSSNTKELADLKHLSQINDIPNVEKKHTTRNYSLSPTTDPESLIVNANSRALHTHNNEFGIENSSSDLTFDSALVHHSTLRNTPIMKPHRRRVFRNNDLHVSHNILHELDNERHSTQSKNRHSSGKHNDVEVSAESGSQYKAQPNRSEMKQLSESHSRSHSYLQHSDMSEDQSKVKNQTEGDKKNEFASSKNNLANQQTENSSQLLKLRRRARSQLPDATDIIDTNKGVLSNVSEKSKNRHSSGKHNDVEVSAESGSQYKALPNRSEMKQLSESRLRSDTVRSRRYFQDTDVSKDLSKAKDQTEGDKENEFASSKNNLANQQTENSSQLLKLRRRARSQLPDATDIIDTNKGALSNVSEKSKNRHSSGKHNDVEVSAESGSQYKALPNRSEMKQLSESHLRSDTVRSRRYFQDTDVSKDLSKAKDQTEGDKENEFASSKNNLANQQTENSSQLLKLRRRARSQLPDATDIIDNNKGLLSNVSKSKRKVMDMSNHDKIDDYSTSNNKGILSNVSGSKRKVTSISNHDQIYVSTSRDNDDNTNSASDSESFVFKFDKPKHSSGPKKSKERLPANKLTRSQENGTICNINRGVPHLPSKTDGSRSDAKLRKFVVRGSNTSFKKPAEWVNNRFYNKLIPFFETKFGPLRYYKYCEDMVIKLHDNVKKALKKPKEQVVCVNIVREILYDVGAIKTPMDFMIFADQYLPNEFNLIAIPKRVGSSEMGVPYPKGIGLFDDLKLT